MRVGTLNRRAAKEIQIWTVQARNQWRWLDS